MHEIDLSYHQQHWLENGEEAKISAFNVSAVAKVCSKIDTAKFNAALNKVVKSNEALRTFFHKKNDRYKAFISDNSAYQAEVIDISLLSKTNIKKLIENTYSEKYNIGKYPLFRVKILKNDQNESLIIISQNHLINDAIGMTIFMKQLKEMYQELCNSKLMTYRMENLQFSEFISKQKSRLSINFDKKIEFWQRLQHSFPLTIRENQRNQRSNISAKICQDINILNHNYQELRTNFILSQFMLGYLISGQTDMFVATPINERYSKPMRNCIGFASGAMTISTKICDNLQIHTLKTNLNSEFRRNMKHYLPIGFLNNKPYHNILINIFDQSFISDINPWENITHKYLPANTMGLEFFINCLIEPQCFHMQIHYDTGLYSKTFMNTYTNRTINIFRALNNKSNDDKTLKEILKITREIQHENI